VLTLAKALELTSEQSFEDWPHRGPRAAREFLEGVAMSGGDLSGYHANYLRRSGLSENSSVAHELKNLLTVLRLAISYDQLDFSDLASIEAIIRRILDIQVAVRRNPKHPEFGGLDLDPVGETDSMGGVRAASYGEWLATESQREAKGLKAAREYREEQAKLKNTGAPNPKGGGAPKP
jgi:hypothetical protein